MITKYGKVVITEDNVEISGFEYDAKDAKVPYIDALIKEAMAWAISKLQHRLSNGYRLERYGRFVEPSNPEEVKDTK